MRAPRRGSSSMKPSQRERLQRLAYRVAATRRGRPPAGLRRSAHRGHRAGDDAAPDLLEHGVTQWQMSCDTDRTASDCWIV